MFVFFNCEDTWFLILNYTWLVYAIFLVLVLIYYDFNENYYFWTRWFMLHFHCGDITESILHIVLFFIWVNMSVLYKHLHKGKCTHMSHICQINHLKFQNRLKCRSPQITLLPHTVHLTKVWASLVFMQVVAVSG